MSTSRAVELTQAPATCDRLDDMKVRAACLRAAAALSATERLPSPIEATPDAVVPVGFARFTDLDERAVFASPAHFTEKPLRLRGVRCSYADVGNYLCTSSGHYRIDVRAEVVMPPPAQDAIETRCRTLTQAQTHACLSTILFTANSIDIATDEGRPKIVISATGVTVVPQAAIVPGRISSAWHRAAGEVRSRHCLGSVRLGSRSPRCPR